MTPAPAGNRLTTRLVLADPEGDVDVGPLTVGGREARPASPDEATDNLPHLASGFVGRQAAIAEVAALLGSHRLVTLAGPGGMGKTRLALQVAAGLAPTSPDGVWFVELAAVTDEASLPAAVAAVLERRDLHPHAPSVDDLVRRIGDRRPVLVLDNCEHLVAACARLVNRLLRACPGVRVLATSREALGVAGEHAWLVGPLSLPAPGSMDVASVAGSEAVELFVRRATGIRPEFRLTDQTAPVVGEICRRLDGMPLAIELAAARVASLAPADILDLLDDRFRLLTLGSRTADPRHQTLAAALEWSHDLLSPGEAALLCRVSVFAGWTLGDAEGVCAEPDEAEEGEVLEHLAALVAKSLVVADTGGTRVRYRLLETVRHWAEAKLAQAGEAAALHRRHALWFVGLAERAEAQLVGEQAQVWLDRFDFEHDNFRAALSWARQRSEADLGLRLAAALSTFWRIRGHMAEGQVWLEWALAANPDASPRQRAKILRAVGLFRGTLGDVVSALPLLEESSTLFAEAGDEGASLCTCKAMFLMCGNPRRSFSELDKRMEFCRETGNVNKLAHLLHTRGQAHFFLAEAAEANRYFEETVRVGRDLADGEALRCGLLGLGRVALLIGDLAGVERWVGEARELAVDMGDLDNIATALALLGDAARTRGDFQLARTLLDQSIRLARQCGSPQSVARGLYFLAHLVVWQGRWAEARELFQQSLSQVGAGGGHGFNEARCLLGLGTVAQAAGDLTAAAGDLMEALNMAHAIGAVQTRAHALDALSDVARLRGDPDAARTLAHQGLELHHQIGELAAVASSLERVGGLVGVGERWEPAARLLGAAQSLRDSHDYARSVAEEARYEADLEMVRSNVGEPAFTSTWERGRAQTVQEAVAYALRGRGARARPTAGWESLTPSERDVLRLIGQGMTNAEVGGQLFMSPRTVGHHLGHVYAKLEIRSRAALVKELAHREL